MITISFSHNATTKHNKKSSTPNSTSRAHNHKLRLETHTPTSHYPVPHRTPKGFNIDKSILTNKSTIGVCPPYV